jgi:hypothetical protein
MQMPALPKRYHAASIWALYAIGLLPAAWTFYLGATGQLIGNPVKIFEHLLGEWALRFLILTLLISPIRDVFGINWVRYRRALGLLAFWYVAMHFLAYMVLDKRLAFDVIVEDVFKRWFITIGMAAFILLIRHACAVLGALGVDIAIDEFDNGHRRTVAGAETGLHDADVAAIAGGVTGRDGVEQLANLVLVADLRDRLAARMQIAALAERDELFDDRANFLGLRQVVTICSCSISEAAMLANIALRWLECGSACGLNFRGAWPSPSHAGVTPAV